MKDKNLKFNVITSDRTYGPNADSGGQLNTNRFIEHIQGFKSKNLLADDARILASRISREGNPAHEELSNMTVNSDTKFLWRACYLD
jgi:hypothetical protein